MKAINFFKLKFINISDWFRASLYGSAHKSHSISGLFILFYFFFTFIDKVVHKALYKVNDKSLFKHTFL